MSLKRIKSKHCFLSSSFTSTYVLYIFCNVPQNCSRARIPLVALTSNSNSVGKWHSSGIFLAPCWLVADWHHWDGAQCLDWFSRQVSSHKPVLGWFLCNHAFVHVGVHFRPCQMNNIYRGSYDFPFN